MLQWKEYAAAASAFATLVLWTAIVSVLYLLQQLSRRAEYAVTGNAFVTMAPGNAMIDA
jgi:hypothetical protein